MSSMSSADSGLDNINNSEISEECSTEMSAERSEHSHRQQDNSVPAGAAYIRPVAQQTPQEIFKDFGIQLRKDNASTCMSDIVSQEYKSTEPKQVAIIQSDPEKSHGHHDRGPTSTPYLLRSDVTASNIHSSVRTTSGDLPDDLQMNISTNTSRGYLINVHDFNIQPRAGLDDAFGVNTNHTSLRQSGSEYSSGETPLKQNANLSRVDDDNTQLKQGPGAVDNTLVKEIVDDTEPQRPFAHSPPREEIPEEEIFPLPLIERPQRIAPPLESNKLYHAFFSYSTDDEEWVKTVIEKLETPEYGFKCCYGDRDFELGAPVFNNIVSCIHNSRKTVIVLSPTFVESEWCSYETRITMEMDLSLKRKLLVPVMVKPCRVPQFIGRLTYMDVGNPHFWQRFVEALCSSEEPGSSSYDLNQGDFAGTEAFQFNPNFHNGQIIKSTPLSQCHNCCGAYATPDMVPDELISMGLTVEPSKYNEGLNKVARRLRVKCHTWCYNKFLIVWALAVLPAVIAIPFTVAATMVIQGCQTWFDFECGENKSGSAFLLFWFIVTPLVVTILFSYHITRCVVMVSVDPDECTETASTVISQFRLRCHGWCYNKCLITWAFITVPFLVAVPFAIAFFFLILNCDPAKDMDCLWYNSPNRSGYFIFYFIATPLTTVCSLAYFLSRSILMCLIDPDEHNESLQRVMRQFRFRNHVCCYNKCCFLCAMPVIPIYLLVNLGVLFFESKKLKKALFYTNLLLHQHQVIFGLEEKGFLSCNRLTMHYVYFDMKKCLSHLITLMPNITLPTSTYVDECIELIEALLRKQQRRKENHEFNLHERETGYVEIDETTELLSYDQLNDTCSRLTDIAPDNEFSSTGQESGSHLGPSSGESNQEHRNKVLAMMLLLDRCNEYVSLMATRTMPRGTTPRRQRHTRQGLCLCQLVEMKMTKFVKGNTNVNVV